MTISAKPHANLDRRPRTSGRLLAHCSLILVVFCLAAGCNDAPVGLDTDDILTQVRLVTFQQPEVVPNVALDDPEPVTGSDAVLERFDDRIQATLATHDLPGGVYTFWWHLIHDDDELSILWAGNRVVSNENGNGQLITILPEGEENAPGFIFLGHGLQPGAAQTVRVELWVRLHGPPSEDPAALAEQLTRPFGLCTDTRNPNPRPGEDYPCWNPQRAVFGQP